MAYDSFMGRYSTRLAPKFAAFAAASSRSRIVDVGAGTGALTLELVRLGASVAAVEPADAFVGALRKRLPMVEVAAATAEALPWPDSTFYAAISQLAVAFMRDPAAALREMRRVVRAGGGVAVCMWDQDGMEMVSALRRAREALGAIDPTSEVGMRYRTRQELEELFGDGFDDLKAELLVVEADYTGFEDFWEALRGGASQSGQWAASLTGEAVDEARAEVSRQLGDPFGSFTLRAAAWAVRATVAHQRRHNPAPGELSGA